jgi:hypothetical protein
MLLTAVFSRTVELSKCICGLLVSNGVAKCMAGNVLDAFMLAQFIEMSFITNIELCAYNSGFLYYTGSVHMYKHTNQQYVQTIFIV